MSANSSSPSNHRRDTSWLLAPSDNPTDNYISETSTLYGPGSEVYSEEWLTKTTNEARREKFIGLRDLIFVMALDERYCAALPKLWKMYGLDQQLNRRTVHPLGDARGVPLESRGGANLNLTRPQTANLKGSNLHEMVAL